MQFRMRPLRIGAGLLSLATGVVLTAPALAQPGPEVQPMTLAQRTITVQIPVFPETQRAGPTRLVGLEKPATLAAQATMLSGRMWASSGGIAGGSALQNMLSGSTVGVIADFGLMNNLQLQVQGGIGGTGSGLFSAMGKYQLLNETLGAAPLSLGVSARLHGMMPPLADLLQLNLGKANVGVSFGVPLSKEITDRLTLVAQPGLSFIGSPTGLTTVANLGFGADFAITDRFRAMVDATIGVPSAGIAAVPLGNVVNAGLRYAFTPSFTSDLYLGIGSAPAGTNALPVSLPSVGLSAAYLF